MNMILGKKIIVDSARLPNWMRCGKHHVVLHPEQIEAACNKERPDVALAQLVIGLERVRAA